MGDLCFPLVRGRVMRATRLTACGAVASHAISAIVSDGFVSVALTANVTEAEPVQVTNAGGKVCVNDPGSAQHAGYGVVITFCNVDPELYAMLTGNAVVKDTTGAAVGFRVNTGVDPANAAFALEVWSNVPGVACSGGTTGYGYTLIPFIAGGVLGDFTIENGAVTFQLTNAATKDGTAWGVGPYSPINGAAGAASTLATALDSKDHLHVQYTTIAPPSPGCVALPSGPAATGATAGIPGAFTPANSYPPEDFTDLTNGSPTVVASPATAWTTGQYVTLSDGSKAHWNGTAWIAGPKP